MVRYLVSGGTGTAALLSAAFLFKDVLKLHYLLASTLSMAVAVIVSFYLQRIWTFNITHTKGIHFQFAKYVIFTLFNILINAIIMYLFVDVVGFRYVFSQVLSAGILAIWSFLIYKHYVFNEQAQVN